ncbi:hypothetical protein LEL_04174 [Akanthomyces lecanii RCEF 1005]|uniref:Uncharacterized protein n=1 Tax=Akanthomyces lecanii RCEF 1005 TaxID=1081108 RepID=A0A168H618_CORDF|nr:hypothetical protein LEL_04174 [Akanthomyces lecanii RCEF 1005]
MRGTRSGTRPGNTPSLPATISLWTKAAKRMNVADTCIHVFPGPRSGSETREPQFLTLQILVLPLRDHRQSIMTEVLRLQYLQAAQAALEANVGWQSYIKSITYVHSLPASLYIFSPDLGITWKPPRAAAGVPCGTCSISAPPRTRQGSRHNGVRHRARQTLQEQSEKV